MRALLVNAWLSAQSRQPRLRGHLAHLLAQDENVLRVGPGLRLGGWPTVQITDGSSISVGADVEIRQGVELRAHQGARIIIEDGVRIDRGVRLLSTNGHTLLLRRGARIGIGSVVNGGDNVDIGEGALISGYVYLQTSMHRHEQSSTIIAQGFTHAPVTIGADCWLGAHVTIMPGVHVGKGAIVGSNAVVTSDVADGFVVAGVPARVLRGR